MCAETLYLCLTAQHPFTSLCTLHWGPCGVSFPLCFPFSFRRQLTCFALHFWLLVKAAAMLGAAQSSLWVKMIKDGESTGCLEVLIAPSCCFEQRQP